MLFCRAIAIGERVFGPEHPLTQRHRSRYARLLVDTERTAEALICAEAALATHESACGSDHPWTKDSARVAADVLGGLGRADEAKGLRARYGVEPTAA